MHRVVAVAELLNAILANADAASRACMAQTCRPFFFPALSFLWREVDERAVESLAAAFLDDDLPVLDAWLETYSPYSAKARAERFDLYGGYIRALRLTDGSPRPEEDDDGLYTEDDVTTQDAFHMSLRRMGVFHAIPLFPNLHSLVYDITRPEHFDILLLLLQPRMEELTVHFEEFAESSMMEKRRAAGFAALLDVLPARTPRLRVLRLVTFFPYESMHLASLLNAVNSLKDLTLFESDLIAFQPSLIGAIAQHPSLREVRVGLDIDDSTYPEPPRYVPITGVVSFLNLRSVYFHSNMACAVGLLDVFPPHLEELKASLIEMMPFHVEDYARIPRQIASRFRHLRTLTMSYRYQNGGAEGNVTWHAFAPLLGIPTITEFEIWVDKPLHVEDADLHSVVHAWPSITSFRMRGKDFAGVGTTTITLDLLRAFATNWPQLRYLELQSLDCDQLPTKSSGNPPPPSLHLERIELAHVRISNPETAAAFLTLLWPRVQLTFERHHRPVTVEDENRFAEEHKQCKEVNRLLRNMASKAISRVVQ